jgi:ABC-type proline/glycine betaine transport system permease subunit
VPHGEILEQTVAPLRAEDGGVIEAAVTLGATPWRIIWKVYLTEGLPALIPAVTIMSLTLISYSAVGGGGLGDLAIRYGYQRFRPDVMLSTVAVLIIIVQAFQFAGNRLARKFDRRYQTSQEHSCQTHPAEASFNRPPPGPRPSPCPRAALRPSRRLCRLSATPRCIF